MAPKILPPVIPNFEIIPAPPDAMSNRNSNTLVYVALGVIVVGGVILIIHLVNENVAMRYQLQALTAEVKTLSAERSSYLLTDSKTISHGTT